MKTKCIQISTGKLTVSIIAIHKAIFRSLGICLHTMSGCFGSNFILGRITFHPPSFFKKAGNWLPFLSPTFSVVSIPCRQDRRLNTIIAL